MIKSKMFIHYLKHFYHVRIKGIKYSHHICHVKKCIYVHIPKTGGLYLNENIYSTFGLGHMDIRKIESLFSSEELEEYFVFTVVRDPIDRTISALNYLSKGGLNGKHLDWKVKYNWNENSINDFILSNLGDLMAEDIHFRPQFEFVVNDSGVIHESIDYIGDYNHFDLVKEEVQRHVDVSFQRTPINKSNKTISRSILNQDTIDFIKECYKLDYKYFAFA